MNAKEAIDYIENMGWSKTRLGLDRTRILLAKLGDPQKRLKFIHVAGSNGKGSTCAMLESILRAQGYRVGLYSSPYLVSLNENIRVNGQPIPDESVGAITERVRDAAEAMDDHPSKFELTTAIAMLYYLESGCDIVVLEVGMGGEMDSTNAIDAPEVAVITNITLEHTEFLGNTIEKIARTKAGIIKRGCHAVCYYGDPVALEVVSEVCTEKGVPLLKADNEKIAFVSGDISGQVFSYEGQKYRLALLGRYQLRNAATVVKTIEALRERGWLISDEAVYEGLMNVKWKARFERLADEPTVILDGGHNPQGAEALVESLVEYFPGKKVTLLMGVLEDKDYRAILDKLFPFSESFYCVTPPSPRALPGEALAELVRNRGGHAESYEDIGEAIEKSLSDAVEADGVLVIFGSLYFAGAVIESFDGIYRKWLRKRKIAARKALTAESRREYSDRICRSIRETEAYRKAEVIMMYRAMVGEVDVGLLETFAGEDGKRVVFPLCVSSTDMIALEPGSEPDAWAKGPFGIEEPRRDRGILVEPEGIDLVVCPCSSFDENCGRLGMGGGYYDRFLLRCENAEIMAVAFEIQKSASVPRDDHDISMELVVTEKGIYR